VRSIPVRKDVSPPCLPNRHGVLTFRRTRSWSCAAATRDVRARSPPSTVSSTASTSTAVRVPYSRSRLDTHQSHSCPRKVQRPIRPHSPRPIKGCRHQAQARQGPRADPGAQERWPRGEEEEEEPGISGGQWLHLTTLHGFDARGQHGRSPS
jgi:hypothetical protein